MCKNKTISNILEERLAAVVAEAVKAMRDEEDNYNTRCTACEIVMLSQLGLRIDELITLQTDQLCTKKLAKTGEKVNCIRCKSSKISKTFEIIANSLCVEAFDTLSKIRDENPLSRGNKYLYILQPRPNSNDSIPISRLRFMHAFNEFLNDKLPHLASMVRPSQFRERVCVHYAQLSMENLR